jgi:hypothetical protein
LPKRARIVVEAGADAIDRTLDLRCTITRGDIGQ